MKEKHAALDEMDYQVHDITDPDQSNFVEPGSVNCVIDKATLDSIICSSELPEGAKVSKMITNIY